MSSERGGGTEPTKYQNRLVKFHVTYMTLFLCHCSSAKMSFSKTKGGHGHPRTPLATTLLLLLPSVIFPCLYSAVNMFDYFNRFGRKKTICCGLFFSAIGSFGSVVLTLFDDGEDKGILSTD